MMFLFGWIFALQFAMADSCQDQLQALCPQKKTPGEIASCLAEKQASLSEVCQLEIKRFLRTNEQASEQGGGSLAVVDGLKSLTPPFPVLTYEGRYSPQTPTMNEDRFQFSMPFYQTQEDYLAASLASGRVHFSEEATLPGGTVAKELRRFEVGAQYNHKLSGYRNWSLRGSLGSSGDRILHSAKDSTFSLNWQYGSPTATGGFWFYGVYLSNNSPLGNYVPIPTVTYFYRTPTFTGLFGFPVLSLQWTPSKPWAYSLSLFGPALSSEAAYGSLLDLQSFATLQWSNQTFILEKRIRDDDRLFLEEKKAGVGLRKLVAGFLQAEVQAGASFERVRYIGKSVRNMRGGSQTIPADSYVQGTFKAAF